MTTLGGWSIGSCGRRGARPTSGLFMAVLLALNACAPEPVPVPPAPEPGLGPDVAVEPEGEPGFVRYSVEPVKVPNTFQEAVLAGTRTRSGGPGPDYWQQRVDYVIDAHLDPEAAELTGEETITYTNNSPDQLPLIFFNLYQNAFREGQPRVREVPVTGGMVIERVVVDGETAREFQGRADAQRPGGIYQINGTIMVVRLPEPLPPGGRTEIRIDWHFDVPPAGVPRMGRIGHELFSIAQWYPQVATYDDVRGWDTWPYWLDGEFYLEYGDFNVSITVPEGWLVAASGTLLNPDEVLTEVVRSRLASARPGRIVRVVTESDFGAGTATMRAPGGWLTWHFRAEDVRDFAFSTSDRYLWDATVASIPALDGTGERQVDIYAFYRPEAEAWSEAARYTRHAITFHSQHWYPYVYPQMTAAEGPVGGMEYPMLTFVSAFSEPELLYSVIDHEVAHMWWPMMVGSREAFFAWQDEGLASYIENLARMDLFPDAEPFQSEMRQYLAIGGTVHEKPMMRNADLYGPGPARGIASYRKPSLILRALAAIIGEETLAAAFNEYVNRWLFKHPYHLDFFRTVEDVAGRDLDWFWHPWWYETGVLDQAITSVSVAAARGGERVEVTIEDQAENPMPVPLVFTLANGSTRDVTVPVDVWLTGDRSHTVRVELDGRVETIAIDPAFIFPDVDRSDNVWERGEGVGG